MSNYLNLPDHIAYLYKNVRVFRTYKGMRDRTRVSRYTYSWCEEDVDVADNRGYQFDIRELPTYTTADTDKTILGKFIEQAVREEKEKNIALPWEGAEGQGEFDTPLEILVLRAYKKGTEECCGAKAYLSLHKDKFEDNRETLRQFNLRTEQSEYPDTTRLFQIQCSAAVEPFTRYGISAEELTDLLWQLKPQFRNLCENYIQVGTNTPVKVSEAYDFLELSEFYSGVLDPEYVTQATEVKL